MIVSLYSTEPVHFSLEHTFNLHLSRSISHTVWQRDRANVEKQEYYTISCLQNIKLTEMHLCHNVYTAVYKNG